MLSCPHCARDMFQSDASRMKLKLSRSVVVLHKSSGEVEINCPHCRGAVMLGKLDGLSLRKAVPRLVVRPMGSGA